jgi:hypothetical protein
MEVVSTNRASDPFRGRISTQFECTNCGHLDAVTVRSFFDLSVRIRRDHQKIEDCVYQAFEKERIEGVHCLGCWLDKFGDSIEHSNLAPEDKKQVQQQVSEIRSLAGCDLDEASIISLRRGYFA